MLENLAIFGNIAALFINKGMHVNKFYSIKYPIVLFSIHIFLETIILYI